VGALSSSASAGDFVVRGDNNSNFIMQTGNASGASIIINVSNNTILKNNTTILSSLKNVTGIITGNRTALSNLNYSSILNPPNLTVYASSTNLNNESTQTYLDIPNMKIASTTILGYVNTLSTNSILLINNITKFSNYMCQGHLHYYHH
jgi:hypothetical protein